MDFLEKSPEFLLAHQATRGYGLIVLFHKFRRKFIVIFLSLGIILATMWIYNDVHQLLKDISKHSWLFLVFFIKWGIIAVCIAIIVFNIKTMFRANEANEKDLDDKNLEELDKNSDELSNMIEELIIERQHKKQV
ncbi:hypothetical protein [Helicobacter cetorum]|uniref:hypothetical protein n=1 Tax=Helicobacter cetorum TaxID=138563 RepID=UPI001F3D6689|nr:hypothetical protein [Helicobacter cetorum]